MALTVAQVSTIKRQNRNPDVSVGPNIHFRNLDGINYRKAVEFFNERVRAEFFCEFDLKPVA